MTQRAVAARDHALHDPRRQAVGRGNLAGVEHADASAGAGADVEPMPPAADDAREHVDGLLDRREDLRHRFVGDAVFAVDQREHVGRARAIELTRVFVDRLGGGVEVGGTHASRFGRAGPHPE